MQNIAEVFDVLHEAGWLAIDPEKPCGIGICCMLCAKYDLTPLHEHGKSCVWYTENDADALSDAGDITGPHGISISVLGDVTVVAELLRARFGERVRRVTPATNDAVGYLCIAPANCKANAVLAS